MRPARAVVNSQLETDAWETETARVRWKKITLIGVGLLGGSLGMALRQRRLAGSVVGFVRRAASVTECEGLGAVHLATLDLRRAVEGAELIVLCTPIAQMRPAGGANAAVAQARARSLPTSGASKAAWCGIWKRSWPARARTLSAAIRWPARRRWAWRRRGRIYSSAPCAVVTPTRKSNPAAVRKVEQLWKSVGSRLAPADAGGAR